MLMQDEQNTEESITNINITHHNIQEYLYSL